MNLEAREARKTRFENPVLAALICGDRRARDGVWSWVGERPHARRDRRRRSRAQNRPSWKESRFERTD